MAVHGELVRQGERAAFVADRRELVFVGEADRCAVGIRAAARPSPRSERQPGRAVACVAVRFVPIDEARPEFVEGFGEAALEGSG